MPIIALYILLGIALLIVLILSIRGSVHIVYENDLKVYFKVLFFKFWLFPEGQIKFDPKKYEKILKGEKEDPSAIIKELGEKTKKNSLVENIKLIAQRFTFMLN